MSSRTRAGRTGAILLVPAGGGGDGMGHLERCLRLARELGPGVSVLASRLDADSRSLLQSRTGRSGAKNRVKVLAELTPGETWDLIVLDARRSSRADLSLFQGRGPVISLDEGGEAREHASFLIDSLPGPPGRSPANLASVAYLELAERSRKRQRGAFHNILVSFGGEDPENLSSRLLSTLLGDGMFSAGQLTVVEGPLFGPREWPPGVKVLRRVTGLAALLPKYDLVFTHFGMTCFEALAAGVPVILLNPSEYHRTLGRAAGIPDIGVRDPDIGALGRYLRNAEDLRDIVDEFNALVGEHRAGRLAGVVRTLTARGSPTCPVCGRKGNPVVGRFPERTYRACAGCGIYYMESFAPTPMRYNAAYFGAEYKAQYGRTYLEDFQKIKSLSRERLRIMRGMAGDRVEGSILDVGCAFGPFLDAAKDEGLPGFGIDVSAPAVKHVTSTLGIPALQASFEEVQRRQLPRRISAVTLWWVIEHFTDPDLVLRKASALLAPGGVLAFSTPNARGISARRNFGLFLQHSPADHFSIFSPRGLRRLLLTYGLELRRVRVTGHHAERFPGLLGKAARSFRLAAALLDAVSTALGLGDTFEAYAVKGDQ